MPYVRPLRARLLLVPLLATAAACGSTVQVSRVSTTRDGLGPVPVASSVAASGVGTLGQPGASGQQAGPSAAYPSAGGVTGGSPGVAGGGEAVPSAGSADDRGPIQLGVLDVGDASAFVGAFGFSASSGPTTQQMFRAMVSWFNRHGGI